MCCSRQFNQDGSSNAFGRSEPVLSLQLEQFCELPAHLVYELLCLLHSAVVSCLQR
jgi:hypothetical protein